MRSIFTRSRLLSLSLPFVLGTFASSGLAMANCALHGTPAEGAQSVTLPEKAGSGPDKEVKPLLDTAAVKLAVLTLRNGTVLPTHDAPVAVTIMALSGSGTVKMGDKSMPLDPSHMVVLPAKVPHEVVPTGGKDLVVLLHYLKSGPPAAGQEAAAPVGKTEEAAHQH